MIYTELEVRGAKTDLHSGMYGGAAPNPFVALAQIIAKLKDENGHILIPGFYDDVFRPALKNSRHGRACRSMRSTIARTKSARRSWLAKRATAFLNAHGRVRRSMCTACRAASREPARRR